SGNIEIADKDNSDDLTRLNRDTTKLTKDLVNTSISSNVDGSIDARVLTANGREQIKQELEKVGQGIAKITLKALLGNEVYKKTEIIIENLKRIKETDPQRYNEIVKAINEYNKEQEALKGSFIPAAVLPIAPAVLEFLVEIGAVSVALGGAYGAKKIGDKYISDGIDIITENEIGLEYKNSYIPKPSNDELENDDFLPDLRREKPKTPVSGGGGLRPRWKDKDGNIFEWDSQHGEMEIYDKQGKHQGSYNPKTKEKKPPVKSRKVKK
ncbi:colicin E3/pyocin S6 family cytotoxin, partial [Campylobacter concisus]|uniref:colicin E3/pyocin S6 family cytotoxin n=1 Tax=Campylobacter concisus TaxID=199 RepID=UPI002156301F